VPKEGVEYPDLSSERYVLMRDEVVAFLRPLIRR